MIIAVIGKDGSGKTTVAINLAVALAKRRKKVALVDANASGHCALYLNITPVRTLNDFLAGRATIAETIIAREGVDCVLSPLSGGLCDFSRFGEIKELKYDYVVADGIPTNLADLVLVVCAPDIASATEAAKASRAARGEGKRAFLILNRVRGRKHEIAAGAIADLANIPVSQIIPESDVVAAAANARRIAMTEDFSALAEKITRIR